MQDFYVWARRFCAYRTRTDLVRAHEGIVDAWHPGVPKLQRYRDERDLQWRQATLRDAPPPSLALADLDAFRPNAGTLDLRLYACKTLDDVHRHHRRVLAQAARAEPAAQDALASHTRTIDLWIDLVSSRIAVVVGGHERFTTTWRQHLLRRGLDLQHWTDARTSLPSTTALVLVCQDACASGLREAVQRMARESNIPLVYGESNAWSRTGVELDKRGFPELPPRIPPAQEPPVATPSDARPVRDLPVPTKAQPPAPPGPPRWYSSSLRDAIELLRAEMKEANLTSVTLTEQEFEYERIEIVRGKL